MIKKYELKAGINDKRQYVYNSQLLNVNETVENLGIPYSGRVLVIDLENIRGGWNYIIKILFNYFLSFNR